MVRHRFREAIGGNEAIEREGQKRYELGVETLVVIENRKAKLNKKSLWIKAKRERLDNRVDLYLALGGGWSEQ